MSRGFVLRARVIASATGLMIGLSACQTAPNWPTPTLPDYQERPPSPNLTIVDARPDSDRITKPASLWITSCDFGLVRIGDDATLPPKLSILRRDLEDMLAGRLKSATLTVTRYRVYLNQRAVQENAATGGRPFDLAVTKILLTPHGCTEGGYEMSEVTNTNSPFIVELAATFDGHEYSVRAVLSPDEEIRQGIGEPAAAAALFAVLRKADLALAGKLSAALQAP
jgi:hypothetical protein